jgi:hypothetical protein
MKYDNPLGGIPMKADGGSRKSGLPRKIQVIILAVAMIISIGMGTMNFISDIASSFKSGMDPGGYNYTDSKVPNPKITYNWIDGVTGGNTTSLGDDNNTDFIPLSFPFLYYDELYFEVAICSNGWVSFVDNISTNNTPRPIPRIDYPFGVIAAMLTNLDPSSGGEVYYKAEPDKFIVTWWDVPVFGTSLLQRFQIVLLDTSEILFQYMKVDLPTPIIPPYDWPGVGIEDFFGEIGLSYDDVIEDELAIIFTQTPSIFHNDLMVTSWDMTPSLIEQGEPNIPIMGLTLTASADAIGVSSITVNLTGSATDSDILEAKLWHDRNGNGLLEPGIDIILITGEFFMTFTNYVTSLSFTLTNRRAFVVSYGSPENLIITYDINKDTGVGTSVGASVGIMYLTGDDTISGLPVSSSITQITASGSDTLSVLCSDLVFEDAKYGQGETIIPMALVTLDTNANRVDMYSMDVKLSPLTTVKHYDTSARVFHDIDNDGQLNTSIDIELGRAPFDEASKATLYFIHPPEYFRITSGTSENLIVVCDIDYNASIGGFISFYMDDSSFNVEPDTVSSAGLPFSTITIEIIPFYQPVIASTFTENPPTIDGQYHNGEWDNSTYVDLMETNGNGVRTILQVANDNETLYLVLDVVGDTTRNNIDVSSISFDTGHDEQATVGAEDQFLIGGWMPNQTAHYIFDGPDTGWVIEDTPFNPGLPNHANLVGDWGYNSSDNSQAWHRIYEYQIPLVLLGVPTPVPSGYTLGFGVGRQDNRTGAKTPGIHDQSALGISSDVNWPIHYVNIMKNMSFLGDLVLRAYNSPPVLEWTGEVGYVSDGVNPDSGSTITQFVYRVKYWDVDNDAPVGGYPKLYIDKPCGTSWGASPYTMTFDSWVGSPGNYRAGAIYTYTTTLSPGGSNYAYYFNATDGLFWAIGDPTIPCSDGPDVSFVNTPPVLNWTGEVDFESDGVNPDSGDTMTQFEYRIKYSDFDNDPPAANYPKLHIEKPCGISWGASPFDMTFDSWVGADGDFSEGAIYTFSSTLVPDGSDYAYYFNASDGTDWAGGEPTIPCTEGPEVGEFNSPPLLEWTGEPGYIIDGVEPDVGDVLTAFEYRIKYSDAENDTPDSGYPKIYIDKPCQTPYGGSPYPMNFLSWVGAEYDYIAGAIYNRIQLLNNEGTDYAYYFNASDGTDWAIGDPTVPCSYGPEVGYFNDIPALDWTGETGYESDGVHPDSGTTLTLFDYRIEYSDGDNEPPSSGYPELHIDKPCGIPWFPPITMPLVSWVGSAGDYVQGAIYSFPINLAPDGDDYAYYFLASDGIDMAVGDPTIPCTDGPIVEIAITPEPPFNLEIHRSPPHIDLNWLPSLNSDEYRIYNSTDRFVNFESWNLLGTTTGTSFQHTNGMIMQTQYYIVRGYNTTGGEGPPSSMGVCAYRSFSTGGQPSSQNWISLPYNSMYKKASDIAGELTESKVTVLGKWDPARQKSIVYWYFRGKWRGTDFDIESGDGLWFRAVSDFEWYVNGTDKNVTLNFNYNPNKRNVNWISLPYTGNYETASEVVAAIEGGSGVGFGSPSTKISAVVKWDESTQSEIRYEYDGVNGWSGTNFAIESMDGIYLEVISEFDWQPELVTPPMPP